MGGASLRAERSRGRRRPCRPGGRGRAHALSLTRPDRPGSSECAVGGHRCDCRVAPARPAHRRGWRYRYRPQRSRRRQDPRTRTHHGCGARRPKSDAGIHVSRRNDRMAGGCPTRARRRPTSRTCRRRGRHQLDCARPSEPDRIRHASTRRRRNRARHRVDAESR